MNTVEKLEGYLALVEMWENSYCPGGIDHDAFNRALRGLSDLANEVMPVYEVAIHKYTLNPDDEDAEVFEDHDGRMDYEELTAWITQESWESSQVPLSVSGADHAWLSSYSYIDPYSGVETWFTLRIRESAEVNYHLYSLFLKGK